MGQGYYYLKYGAPLLVAAIVFMLGFSLDSPIRISVTSFMFALSKFIVDMIYDRGLEERIKKTKRDIYIRQARHSITALHEVNLSDFSTTHCHILSLSIQLSELISCSKGLIVIHSRFAL